MPAPKSLLHFLRDSRNCLCGAVFLLGISHVASAEVSCQALFLGMLPIHSLHDAKHEFSPAMVTDLHGGHVKLLATDHLGAASVIEELKSKDFDADWVRANQNRPWDVIRSEYAMDRTGVHGEKFYSYYSKWTPVHYAKPLGTVILQHGFGRSSRYFHDVIVVLTHVGYEVITPDGANIGASLELSGADHPLQAPSPVDDAVAIRKIVKNEKIDRFVLVGHSRGHAVTAAVAGMPGMESKIIRHLAVNPYTDWLVDNYIDHNIASLNPVATALEAQTDVIERLRNLMQMTFLNLFPNSGIASSAHAAALSYKETSTALLRQVSNLAALNFLETNFIPQALHHRAADEVIPGLSITQETNAIRNIANGLAGKNLQLPGFSTFWLYGVESPSGAVSAAAPNGGNDFGFKRYGIQPLTEPMRSKTEIIWGGSDELVTPEIVKPLLSAQGVQSREFPNATHYFPTEAPASLAQLIINAFKENAEAAH